VSGRAAAAVAAAFEEEWGRVVATLIGTTGDWDVAEDCAQEAFEQALRSWTRDGVPQRPGAWLTTVARNRAHDRLRRRAVESAKLELVAGQATEEVPSSEPGEAADYPDDRLPLLFTCCHPALPFEARVALTLRTLTGLTTAEIARAFLVPEQTMAKRLVRAKQKIRHAGIPYRVPPPELLPQRTSGVLAVLYLLFNEGYTASSGADLVRQSLCDDAIRLARALVELLPAEPEAAGLLALMLFQSSRRRARVAANGQLLTLEEQDRSLWDGEAIAEAGALLAAAAAHGRIGPYQLQAAIAGCHAAAGEAGATDWPAIVRLYRRLADALPSPVVDLNGVVAVAMAEGPAAGLARLEPLESNNALRRYHLLHAVRADLLRRLGRHAEAAASYRTALELAGSEAERRFLGRRLAEAESAAVSRAS
jgi:RNA polymerase sigma-70 factor, ECF subfamily